MCPLQRRYRVIRGVPIGQAVVVLFFAFAGWEAIAHLSPEFRNVRRTLPLATLLTIVIITMLYLGVAFAVVGTGTYGMRALDRVSLGVIIEEGLGLSAAAALDFYLISPARRRPTSTSETRCRSSISGWVNHETPSVEPSASTVSSPLMTRAE